MGLLRRPVGQLDALGSCPAYGIAIAERRSPKLLLIQSTNDVRAAGRLKDA